MKFICQKLPITNSYRLSSAKLLPRACSRWLSAEVQKQTQGEIKITEILKNKFPGHREVKVEDISGGCGAMYQISIEAEEFRGKRTVQQHMLVNEALKNEIKEMHGLRIISRVPS